jgi:uncharacterized protein YdeI (BOF family)
MKNAILIGMIMLMFILSSGRAMVTSAAESIGPSAPGSSTGGDVGGADETLQGEVLKIDGDRYFVRDVSGNNVSFRINERTKMEVTPQVGDKIEALVTEGGQARNVKKGKKE